MGVNEVSDNTYHSLRVHESSSLMPAAPVSRFLYLCDSGPWKAKGGNPDRKEPFQPAFCIFENWMFPAPISVLIWYPSSTPWPTIFIPL